MKSNNVVLNFVEILVVGGLIFALFAPLFFSGEGEESEREKTVFVQLFQEVRSRLTTGRKP